MSPPSQKSEEQARSGFRGGFFDSFLGDAAILVSGWHGCGGARCITVLLCAAALSRTDCSAAQSTTPKTPKPRNIETLHPVNPEP